MNLAYAELYLVLSGLWRRFGGPETKDEHGSGWMELYETDRRDVEMEYDLFVPYGKRDSEGIRITIHKLPFLAGSHDAFSAPLEEDI
jgi:hypothetical protein